MRRRIVPGLAGGLPVAPVIATAAFAADLDSPIVSGLPWGSGMSCAGAPQEAWRSRKLDVTVIFIPSDSWSTMLDRPKTAYFKSKLVLAQELVISMPMMPNTEFKHHAACARGDFDGYFRQMGALLDANPVTARAVIRLGWEFNRGSRSHPWGIDTAGEIPDYVKFFRREAAALKSAAPRLRIEWTLGRYTSAGMTSDILTSYPGDG